jgi:glycosyltransferase involved in cell wall biosynthesis
VNQQKPLTLSIVIPAYNEENHIKACLDAIALQSEMPDEVIVVDNNSTDKTAEIAQEYSFVRVVREKRQGIVYARNRGFNTVKSQLIGRIDSDTILPTDWVERVKEFYEDENHSEHALTGGGYFYNVRLPRFNGWVQGQVAYRFIRLNLGFYSLWGSNMVLPKSVWDAVEPKTCKRNDIHEDVELGIHLNEMGYKITYRESLRVGVYARRIWTERDQLKQALARWPQTMRVHQRKSWWVSSMGNALLLSIVIPFGMTLEYFATVTGRR